jgi:hypothetical protein
LKANAARKQYAPHHLIDFPGSGRPGSIGVRRLAFRPSYGGTLSHELAIADIESGFGQHRTPGSPQDYWPREFFGLQLQLLSAKSGDNAGSQGEPMFFDELFRFATVLTKSSRPGLIILVGLVLVIVSSAIKSDASIYVAGFGIFVIVLSSSVEMFAYLQDSRRRFMRDRAYIEKRYPNTGTPSLQAEVQKLRSELAKLKKTDGGGQVLK